MLTYGANTQGQLGQGHVRPVFSGTGNGVEDVADVPAIVKSLLGKRVVQISAGAQHAMALTDAGDVYSWGSNGSLQQGSDVPVQPTPRYVLSLSKALVDASAAAAGLPSPRGKGSGVPFPPALPHTAPATIKKFRTETAATVASKVPADHVVYISAGAHFCVAVSKAGRVFTWGDGRSGQLGQGDGNDIVRARAVPQPAVGLNGIHIQSVATGFAHVIALSGMLCVSW